METPDERTIQFSDVEWEELAEEARLQSAERARDVTVRDVVRLATREYVYRSKQRRKKR